MHHSPEEVLILHVTTDSAYIAGSETRVVPWRESKWAFENILNARYRPLYLSIVYHHDV